MTKERAALAGLVAALTSEHPKEKSADPVHRALRTINFPEEAETVTESVLSGKWHTLPPELELVRQQIAHVREGWTWNLCFVMLSYEEARKRDPRVDEWMLPAEKAALRAHGYICEDGPELPKEEGQRAAQEGREVVEGMCATGCVSSGQARIQVSSGMPRTGVGSHQMGKCTRELDGGGGIQSAQERVPTPVPSDEDEEEMTYDQRRLINDLRQHHELVVTAGS
jgi:hypothetical protein